MDDHWRMLSLGCICVVTFLFLGIVVQRWRSNSVEMIISPITWIATIGLFYAGIGPMLALLSGATILHQVEHNASLWLGSLGFLGCFVAFTIGYYWTTRERQLEVAETFTYSNWLVPVGVTFMGVGFLLFMCYTGPAILYLMVPLESFRELGWGWNVAWKYYYLQGINLFIPGTLCLFLASLTDKYSMFWALFWIATSSWLFIQMGFRYRLLWLGMGILVIWCLYQKALPAPKWIFTIGIFSLLIFGIVKEVRNYHAGVDFKILTESQWFRRLPTLFLQNGFGETSTALATSRIIEAVPKEEPYILGQPLWETLVSPVPRAWWPQKPTGNHLDSFYRLYSKERPAPTRMLAFLLPGEFYLMGGWLGIGIGGLGYGCVTGVLFRIYWSRRINSFAVILYAALFGWLFFIFTRGYLPQHLIQFSFTLLPLLMLIGWQEIRKWQAIS